MILWELLWDPDFLALFEMKQKYLFGKSDPLQIHFNIKLTLNNFHGPQHFHLLLALDHPQRLFEFELISNGFLFVHEIVANLDVLENVEAFAFV